MVGSVAPYMPLHANRFLRYALLREYHVHQHDQRDTIKEKRSVYMTHLDTLAFA